MAYGKQGAREQRAAQDKGHAHVPGQRPAAARASPTVPPWPRGYRKKRPHGSGHDTARGHSPPRARVRRGVRRCVRFVRALCPRHRRQLQCGLAALIGRKALPGGGQLRRAGRLSSFFVREKMRTRNFWASGTYVSTRRCALAHDTPLRRDDGQHLACVEVNALVYKQLQDLVCALEGNLCRYGVGRGEAVKAVTTCLTTQCDDAGTHAWCSSAKLFLGGRVLSAASSRHRVCSGGTLSKPVAHMCWYVDCIVLCGQTATLVQSLRVRRQTSGLCALDLQKAATFPPRTPTDR